MVDLGLTPPARVPLSGDTVPLRRYVPLSCLSRPGRFPTRRVLHRGVRSSLVLRPTGRDEMVAPFPRPWPDNPPALGASAQSLLHAIAVRPAPSRAGKFPAPKKS